MKKYRRKGTITVFLSLISVLFLSLACTLVESARIQGARAQAGAITDMGLFSVFAEYEPELLKQYGVLFLDGAYGSGEFQIDKVGVRMKEFMEYNANPGKGLVTGKNFNLFPLQIKENRINQYALATDESGGVFYQQAVTNYKENLGSELVNHFQNTQRQAREQEQAGRAYEECEREIERKMEELEEEPATEPVTESATEPIEAEQTTENEEAKGGRVNPENPLDRIKELKKAGILGLVIKDINELSTREVVKSKLPSERILKKGNLPVQKKQSGIVAEGLFHEYLISYFDSMPDREADAALSYQLEYILKGKGSDRENLKSVVNQLLLMREGTNFIYIMGNAKMRSEARTLALALTTAIGMPAAAAITEAALTLAWAYGESLLDVRTLLAGGKVPLIKSESTWKLSLENLNRLNELLKECDDGGGEGQSYLDYLRILLCMGEKSKYPMRALDLIECNLRRKEETKEFWADACIAKTTVSVEWNLPPVFLKVPAIFLGSLNKATLYEVQGIFGY